MQAESPHMPAIDFISLLVSDELRRRSDRLLERRTKRARFRDTGKSLDTFNFGRFLLTAQNRFHGAAGHLQLSRDASHARWLPYQSRKTSAWRTS